MNISKSLPLAVEALDFRAIRQKMISGNIANVDTPYYRARDIRFEDLLAKEAHLLQNETRKLEMAHTHPMHLDYVDGSASGRAERFFRGAHPTRNDGNDVDIDVESTEMSKNAIMFDAMSNAIKKQAMIFKSVIDASGKVQ
ncbi:MAG TPA: flagellar basal body rod protein FlgB [Epsilonproteobacteria bacterium]|nr:flagellar basal body rod protein FlgB [Campylobacterota bacterium]